MKLRLLIGILTGLLSSIYGHASLESKYDPCCSFPCEHYGICNRVGFSNHYTCDCYGTGYYGETCQKATFSKWIEEWIRPSQFTIQKLLTHGKYVWKVLNYIKPLHSFIMRIILNIRAFSPPWPEYSNTAADYATWDGYANRTYYALTLPPVPKNCPRAMGVVGPKVLPDVHELVRKVFTRTEFKPCPRGTSAILPFYGQHFTHQGFKSYKHDRSLTWGTHTIDLSHIYGETLRKQLSLRSLNGGKMKMQILNGEEYPPNVKDCPDLKMLHPPQVPEHERFCMGQPFFALLPALLYWSTLWLREHNRICDILAEEHPHWDDERLFQTARLILHGVTLKVTVEDYVQHVSGMHLKLTYEPDLIHDSDMRWGSSRLHMEFNTLYHWHNTMPDYFLIGDKNYTLEETYYNMKPLLDHGMAVFTTSLSNQSAGRGAGGRNMHKSLLYVAENTIKVNRQIRLQSFNRYRKYFRLPPYKSFEDLTGETKLAKVLSDLYDGEIDALEYFVGIMVEKRFRAKMWGITHIEAIAYYAIRSVFSNPIGSPQYWRESTFGGKVGFNIVKEATLQEIVCRNIEGCPTISFQIPDKVREEEDQGMVYNDINESPKEHGKTEL